MKTLLITGAAGGVGSALRRALAGKFALRLSDLRPVKQLAPGETFVRADIARLDDFLRISRGVDAIVHLGGYSVEGPWPRILRANIVGCHNAYEAARRRRVADDSSTLEAVTAELVHYFSGMFIWGHPRAQINVVPSPTMPSIIGGLLPSIYNPNLLS